MFVVNVGVSVQSHFIGS